MKGCSAVRLMAFMVSPYYSASARARLFKKMFFVFFTETPPPLQKKTQTNWKVLVQFWQLERSGFILGNKIWLTANFTSFYKSLGLGQRKPGQHKPLLAILFHNYFQITWQICYSLEIQCYSKKQSNNAKWNDFMPFLHVDARPCMN